MQIKLNENSAAFKCPSGEASISGNLTNDTMLQKPIALGMKRPGQVLPVNHEFGATQPQNQMLTSLRAALTQQMALQDSMEEMPFTAKQLQRDMDSQEE